MVKNTHASAGGKRGVVSFPGAGRFPGEGHGNPLQYSSQENPKNRGAQWPTVHSVPKSQT